MKKLFLLLTILCCISIHAQGELKITSKKCIPKKGYHIKLIKVFDDSRCPEGVTCIWSGEVSAVIEVYKDKQFIEEKTIIFNSENREVNIKWFEKYYPKKIKLVTVLPYPKEGVVVKPKNKCIKVVFQD